MGKILGEILVSLFIVAVAVCALLYAVAERPLLALWARLARWKQHGEELEARMRRVSMRERAARDAAMSEIFGDVDSNK